MIPRRSRGPEHVLAIIIAALMVLQSAGGLILQGLYRDNARVTSAWLGNDLVTLFIAVPLLLGSAAFALKGSLQARLIYLGLLYYELYNNMYYLFGAAFNRFFLIYEALLVLSASALILGLSKITIVRVGEAFKPAAPRKWASGFMLLLAAVLCLIWIGQIVSSLASGSVPRMVTNAGWLTHLVAVFDLSMIVPPLLLGAVWLWESRPWGYVTASIVLVQCAMYSVVLIAIAPFQAAAGIPGAWDLTPLWSALGAGCLLFAVLLLAHMRSSSTSASSEH
jgi:hypothetical protein